MTTLTFTEIVAFDLAQADSRSDSDPFVVFKHSNTEIARTETVWNRIGRSGGRRSGSDQAPRWNDVAA